jgi:hypothetical protein
MTRSATVCLAALLVLACLVAPSYAGDEYLVPKKDFGAAVKRLQVGPVLDSLRESTVALIDRVDKGYAFSDDAMKDPAFANYIAQAKQAQKSQYFLAATVLKLYVKNSRDSIVAAVDAKVRQALARTKKFAVDTLAAPAAGDEPAGLGRLSVVLRVDDAVRPGGKTKDHASAVVLSARVLDRSGRTLWQSQAQVAPVMADDTMASVLSDKALDAAVKAVFKTLVR